MLVLYNSVRETSLAVKPCLVTRRRRHESKKKRNSNRGATGLCVAHIMAVHFCANQIRARDLCGESAEKMFLDEKQAISRLVTVIALRGNRF